MPTTVELPEKHESEEHAASVVQTGSNGIATNGSAANGSAGNGQMEHAPITTKPWTQADSARLYGIQQWGNGYFSVNNDGHVAVHPTQTPAVSIDLKKL